MLFSQTNTVLPISQIPSLPSCIHFVAECMPIEDMFHVPILAQDEDTIESKKTWREDMPRAHVSQPARDITAGDIMEARAVDRGYCELQATKLTPVTAKGGRPDSNRAGNQSRQGTEGTDGSAPNGRGRTCALGILAPRV